MDRWWFLVNVITLNLQKSLRFNKTTVCKNTLYHVKVKLLLTLPWIAASINEVSF